MDDTTAYDISNSKTSNLQKCLNEIEEWSKVNKMVINVAKTKEMIVNFQRNTHSTPSLSLNYNIIETVSSVKLLGVYISDDLRWNVHVEYIVKKASQRIYFLIVLKRSGVSPEQLVQIYNSIIRSVLEYAAQVWHISLTKKQSDTIEQVQKRVMNLIYPWLKYTEALQKSKIKTLAGRRRDLCQRFFNNVLKQDNKLNDLLPEKYSKIYNLRTNYVYQSIQCKTNRF